MRTKLANSAVDSARRVATSITILLLSFYVTKLHNYYCTFWLGVGCAIHRFQPSIFTLRLPKNRCPWTLQGSVGARNTKKSSAQAARIHDGALPHGGGRPRQPLTAVRAPIVTRSVALALLGNSLADCRNGLQTHVLHAGPRAALLPQLRARLPLCDKQSATSLCISPWVLLLAAGAVFCGT
eukprot:477867-Pleurochrysis_carterae.AAC.3